MKKLAEKKLLVLLGKRIRELRIRENISQAQLGFEIGRSREQVNHIENGRVNTSFFTLYKIAQSLNVEFEELFNFLKE